jgi:N-formylglutamate deformylase
VTRAAAPDAAGPRPPIVLHVPHASTRIPPALRASFVLDDPALARELLRMTDHHTDRLFPVGGVAHAVVFPASRLVCDPERFEDDLHEPMASRGMGVLYTLTADGAPLRAVPGAAQREALLARFYRPHHARLERAVDAVLARHGRCLVVDAHSFPSRALPYEPDRRPDRPQVCVGTDPFHTPAALAARAAALLREAGLEVAFDRPFAGALVPASRWRRDARVSALMIEIRRDLYMDERTGAPAAGFDALRGVLAQVLPRLAHAA